MIYENDFRDEENFNPVKTFITTEKLLEKWKEKDTDRNILRYLSTINNEKNPDFFNQVLNEETPDELKLNFLPIVIYYNLPFNKSIAKICSYNFYLIGKIFGKVLDDGYIGVSYNDIFKNQIYDLKESASKEFIDGLKKECDEELLYGKVDCSILNKNCIKDNIELIDGITLLDLDPDSFSNLEIFDIYKIKFNPSNIMVSENILKNIQSIFDNGFPLPDTIVQSKVFREVTLMTDTDLIIPYYCMEKFLDYGIKNIYVPKASLKTYTKPQLHDLLEIVQLKSIAGMDDKIKEIWDRINYFLIGYKNNNVTANKEITIGLFGTCGDSNWRKKFIETYDRINISYFNPQVSNWNPELAEIEAQHLATDEIILFPITSETYGLGSLSECGFSILNAIKLEDRRNLIILIDSKLDSKLKDEKLIKESLRARALVKQHLKKLDLPNVYLVNTLNKMLEVSLILYQSEYDKNTIKKYSIKK